MKLLCFFGAHERAFPGSNLTCRRTFESHHLGDLQRSTGGQLPPRTQQKLQYPQRCIAAENNRNHHQKAYHIPSYTHGFYPGMWSHHQAAATENKHLEHKFNWSPVQWGWYYIYIYTYHIYHVSLEKHVLEYAQKTQWNMTNILGYKVTKHNSTITMQWFKHP